MKLINIALGFAGTLVGLGSLISFILGGTFLLLISGSMCLAFGIFLLGEKTRNIKK